MDSGNGASVARIVPYAALHYMAYEEYRRWIIFGFPDTTRGPLLDLVAGSFAGGTAVLFTYPLDLVRTKLAYQVISAFISCISQYKLRLIENPAVQVVGSAKSQAKGVAIPLEQIVYRGITDCFSRTYRESGFKGLYRGVGNMS